MKTKTTVTDEGPPQSLFHSKTVFNLSQRLLSKIEIQDLEKVLDFEPMWHSINEPKIKKKIFKISLECALDGISGRI